MKGNAVSDGNKLRFPQVQGLVVMRGTVSVSTSAKTFQVQYYTSRVQTSNGLGVAAGIGQDEIYHTLKIRRIA